MRVCCIAGFELENLLHKKAVWLLNAVYAAVILAVCLSEELRQSYFTVMNSVPVMLMDFMAPVFLAMILIGALAPVFAGDREQNTCQIPATCLAGREERCRAKLLAAVLFAVLACLFLGGVTFAVSRCCHLYDGSLRLESMDAGTGLSPVWTERQHFVFSLVCLTVACVILALFILFVSCNVKTTLNAVTVSGIFVIFEFLFHRFSFPEWIREYNIWGFFDPCSFFCMTRFSVSPYGNLLLLLLAFMPLCLAGIWWVIRRGDCV